jgi:hypothetical protein
MAVNAEQYNDIDPRLPLLVVGVLIMEKRLWTQRTSEPAKSDLRPSSSTKEEWSLTSWLIQLFQTQYKEIGLWLK